LGFNMLHGLARVDAERIVASRGDRPFASMDDLARRSGLRRPVLSRLAKAGAFDSLQLNRREALWHALGQDQTELPLFDAMEPQPAVHLGPETQGVPSAKREAKREESMHGTAKADGAPNVPKTNHLGLPKMSPAEEVLADYRTTGLSLKAHPLEFLRSELEKLDVVPAERLATWPNGKPVRVAGIVLVRQRPGTAKGITFVTLEDETGTANLIIRPGVWKRYRQAALGATLMLAQGQLQRQSGVIHVLTTKLENLSPWLAAMASQSRDFC
jgi:DNA polymerase III alpha subunit